MTALSVLDLVPIRKGQSIAYAIEATVALAQEAEACGFTRYWIAEHHNMPGFASSATALLISHVAAATRSIRVGSGGVMLPNHSPLVVAEQFGTLETLYPGRIDLGMGRAPGADDLTARALRRVTGAGDAFPADVSEVIDYLSSSNKQPVKAVPGAGLQIPIWILGSGMFGAQLAAALGRPYAFASHFAPTLLRQAVEVYRQNFQPSEQLSKPYVMVGVNAFAAETFQEAERLASSHRAWVGNLHSGRSGLLPEPVDNYLESIPTMLRESLMRELQYTALGTTEQVGDWLREFIAWSGADELMIDARIYDPASRARSYRLIAEALKDEITPGLDVSDQQASGSGIAMSLSSVPRAML